jgi:hypothetical protein
MSVSVKKVMRTLQRLSEAQLQNVENYIAFLKWQERRKELSKLQAIDDETLGKLYAQFAEEDRAMAEEGMADYKRGLEREDQL